MDRPEIYKIYLGFTFGTKLIGFTHGVDGRSKQEEESRRPRFLA